MYLQLLIDQIRLIESKRDAVEDEDRRDEYTAVLSRANAMLNSIKHTIVQLQIAKVSATALSSVVSLVFLSDVCRSLLFSSTSGYTVISMFPEHGDTC